ncbi:hypothetical protein ABGB17_09340 [Sphaerisporangium sp. B11E5]|uniref:hypothetical protein n=1 Tax=Sphaerisporangium sp. B11E5 TaxID=3153563 RepID=UPI00325E78F4
MYVAALTLAVVIALTAGDLGALWYLTLFTKVEQGVAVTLPNVLALVTAGVLWAWALWQTLRGPLAGPPPELDRDARRLRVALYAATATGLLSLLVPSWPWWTAVPNAVAIGVVMVLFRPVLGRNLGRAGHTWIAGVLAYGGYGGSATVEVLDVFGRRVPDGLALAFGLAGLVWTVLVLRAQGQDGRWQRATVLYGVAFLVMPFVLMLVGPLLAIVGNVYVDATAATGALILIWLARSAHELADPHPQPAPPSPLLAQPPT